MKVYAIILKRTLKRPVQEQSSHSTHSMKVAPGQVWAPIQQAETYPQGRQFHVVGKEMIPLLVARIYTSSRPIQHGDYFARVVLMQYILAVEEAMRDYRSCISWH